MNRESELRFKLEEELNHVSTILDQIVDVLSLEQEPRALIDMTKQLANYGLLKSDQSFKTFEELVLELHHAR